MTFRDLALIMLAGLVGPLLASRRRLTVPLVVGEIGAGIALGASGLGLIDATTPVAQALAQTGFAVLMLVVGMRLPLRTPGMRSALGRGLLATGILFVLAVPLAVGLSHVWGVRVGPLIVVLAACSASTALPALQSLSLPDRLLLPATAWIVAADAGAIVAMPVVFHPSRIVQVVLGAATVSAVAAACLVATRAVQAHPEVTRLRAASHARGWALDLRLSLLGLFATAYLAQRFSLSVLVAGFSAGIVLAIIGDSHRLFMQLLGIGEGFLIPLFFVTLGARLQLRALGADPQLLLLVLALLACIVAMRLVAARAVGAGPSVGLVASAQLGVPAAVVSIGLADGTLTPGVGSALIAAAVLSLGVSAIGARRLAASSPATAAAAAAVVPLRAASAARGGDERAAA